MLKPTYVVPPLCVSVQASATLRALRFGQIKQPRLPLPAQLKSVTTHPPHVLVSAKVLLQSRRAKGGFSFGAQAFHAQGRFHQAGVNAITHLVQAGVDLPTVKRISGHKTLAMVERYSHQNGGHIPQAMDKLTDRYQGKNLGTMTQELHKAKNNKAA